MAKTALQITKEDMAVYRATARRQAEQRHQKQLKQTQQAQKFARQAAKLLKEEFNASRISPRDFWRAWAALDRLGNEFEIDLVDIETASPKLRLEIEHKGVEL